MQKVECFVEFKVRAIKLLKCTDTRIERISEGFFICVIMYLCFHCEGLYVLVLVELFK